MKKFSWRTSTSGWTAIAVSTIGIWYANKAGTLTEAVLTLHIVNIINAIGNLFARDNKVTSEGTVAPGNNSTTPQPNTHEI